MNRKCFTTFLAGALAVTTVLPFAVQAGRGGNGQMGGTGQQMQTRTQDRDQLRQRDGSCLNQGGAQTGSRFKSGNTYGPGDGTGNGGGGPRDGSGYGAPARQVAENLLTGAGRLSPVCSCSYFVSC